MTRVKMHPKLQALQRWERIARGEPIDDETREWLTGVASALVQATAEKDANRRRLATIDAVGLSGRASWRSYALQTVVHEAASLVALEERPKMTRVMAGVVVGHAPGTEADIGPEALRKRIERAKKKRP